jgi:hypothetical protein
MIVQADDGGEEGQGWLIFLIYLEYNLKFAENFIDS